jgi:iron complex outermembrane receptor protein
VKENPPRIGYLDDYIGLRGRVTYDQQRSSSAIFGQGLWDLTEKWRVTAGLRFLSEKIDSFESEVSFLFPPDFDPAARLPLAVIPNQYTDGTLDDTAWLGRLAVDYMPNEDLLFYTSISNGYKGGGFNGGLVTNPELYLPFKPEEVVAYEFGMKSTLANGRATFNAAIFTYDYKNLQAATPTPSPASGNVLNFLTNLEDAKISGLEAEIRWLITPQFDIKLGIGLLDTENKDPGKNFDGPFGNSPRELANSPSSTFNAAIRYDIPLESGARVRLALDGFYNAAHYKEIVNNVEVDGQGMLNGQIIFMAPGDRWSVSLWGRNLTDEDYIVDTLTDPINTGWGVFVYGMPRTYGLSAEYHF